MKKITKIREENARVPRHVLRNFFVFLFVLSVVVVTQISLRPTVEAKQEEQKNGYLEYKDNVSGMVNAYHTKLNVLFNKRVAALNDAKTPEEIVSLVKVPAKNAKGVRECKGKKGKPNLSTYCLAESGMVEFFQLRQGLEAARRGLNEKAVLKFTRLNEAIKKKEEEAGKAEKPASTGDDIVSVPSFFGDRDLNKFGIAIQRIDLEIDIAEKTLDQALTAYNEFQMAMPLHRKNKQIIEALENYRDAVAEVRDEVVVFPFKFINVSTTQCT